jgi:hypothetical protein
MISQNELRIGNWVEDFGDGYGRVEEIYLSDILTSANPVPQPIETFRPIPLTSEILDKIDYFGKTFHEGQPCYFNGDDILILSKSMELFKHSEVDGETWYIKKVKWVHELQNLIFAISHDRGAGTELEIKL